MKPVRRRPTTVSIIPERKHARPTGTRLITRSTTVRPFVYTLPSSDHSEKPASESKKSKVKNQENVAGAYNSHISHLDNSLANKTAISNDSLYCTTPNKSVSPRNQRFITRSLLKEFELTQDDAGNDIPKISNVQKKELQLKAFKSLSTEDSLEKGSLKRSFKRDTVLLTHPQKISNTSQSQQCNQFPQEESIILKRKNSFSTDVAVSHKSLQTRHSKRNLLLKQNSNTSHSDIFEHSPQEKVVINRKRKHSINIAISHEMSIVVSKTSVTTKSQSIGSSLTKRNSINHVMSQQSSSVDTNLTQEQSTRLEQTSLFSAIAAKENHSLANTSAKSKTSSTLAVEGPREADISTYGNIDETFHELVSCQPIKLKECHIVLDCLPLFSQHLAEKTVEEFSSESKQNENSGKLNYNKTLNEHPTIDGEIIENKKEENTVIDDRCFIKVNKDNEQEPLLAESKSPTKSATSFPRVLLENISQLNNQSECLATSNDNVDENTEKDVTDDEHLKVNTNNEQEPLLRRSKTSERSATSFSHVLLENTSQLKKCENLDSHAPHQILSDNIETTSHSMSVNNDNAQEQLSLVKSVSPLQAPLESISQLKNQSENAEEINTLIKKISEISTPSLRDHPKTLSKTSPTVENISSSKVRHQNLVSNNHDSESLIFEQAETSLSQGKGLRHPSSERLTYNAIVGVRRTSTRRPRKPKPKTKPEDHLNVTVDHQQPLFEGHKKIKFWKGETGNRSISDLTDLDIALNVIEQVIEEISKEDQNKEDILRIIQENYNSSFHAMIMKAQSIKRKNKEIKELMATVKEVASELDHTVDNKIRLQSKILELKAQQKTSNAIADGPTWEDMNYL